MGIICDKKVVVKSTRPSKDGHFQESQGMTTFKDSIADGVPHQGHSDVQLPDIESCVELVSSTQAACWLEEYRGPNRRISELQVLKFQSDMENGRWHFEAAPIKISKTGKLLDGQHRLTALANTIPEMELPFLVVRGLDDDSQLYMDQGQIRTVGQQLSLRGVSNSSVYAALSKLYLDWSRNRLFRSTTRGCTSKPEITEWVLENQILLDKLRATDFQKIDAPSSVVGAFMLAAIQASPARAYRFLKQLNSGTGLHEGDPILALDRRLRNIRKNGQKVSSREYLAYFIKGWNAWVTGDRLSKLQLSPLNEENFPELLVVVEPEPQPWQETQGI